MAILQLEKKKKKYVLPQMIIKIASWRNLWLHQENVNAAQFFAFVSVQLLLQTVGWVGLLHFFFFRSIDLYLYMETLSRLGVVDFMLLWILQEYFHIFWTILLTEDEIIDFSSLIKHQMVVNSSLYLHYSSKLSKLKVVFFHMTVMTIM